MIHKNGGFGIGIRNTGYAKQLQAAAISKTQIVSLKI
jgi:hypothetical protein